MANGDWADAADAIAAASLRRGVTSGLTPPNGGGTRIYGYNSAVAAVTGAHALIYDGLANFNPTPANTLGRIEGALIRLPSSGATGFAPFLFVGLQGASVEDSAYMLGLQDEDPSSIVLRKGALDEGLPAGIVGESGILRKSSDTFEADTWVHLRMDCIVQGTGDVLIQMFQNDIAANGVDAPVWTAIDGMDDFVDDALGINSGSVPFTSGRFGFGMYMEDISRRAAFDQVRVERQL